MSAKSKDISMTISGIQGVTGIASVTIPQNNLSNKTYKGFPIGLQGITGMAGIPSCSLCNQSSTSLKTFDEDFKEQRNGIAICPSCVIKTKLRLEEIKNMPLDELPLHIDDTNPIILHLIKKRFNQENYMDESIEKQKKERDEEKKDTQRQRDTEVAINAALNAATIAGSIGCV